MKTARETFYACPACHLTPFICDCLQDTLPITDVEVGISSCLMLATLHNASSSKSLYFRLPFDFILAVRAFMRLGESLRPIARHRSTSNLWLVCAQFTVLCVNFSLLVNSFIYPFTAGLPYRERLYKHCTLVLSFYMLFKALKNWL